ncbi:NAD(P)/FAD-dependent oxidoreductase [Manganibacter manganicus]|uniref:Thioredoxin reductase n=1 Tax=Manganibacter manganicus TaxID=1873176 RepID=A0A1V8RLI6_9HYPH|nr:NAD(P)/FAD-dependent oxidoreductase [Pseudaminobacter manganicus]OQM74062.1 pyridine nucleotide-disulfide oxidoreductase [Pseudaminobacter manganicus]
MMTTVDTVVVGAGVAGLSAALFLARAGRSTVVFDGGPSRIHAVEEVREYIGFDGASPTTVLRQARDEAVCFGAEIRSEMVDRIDPLDDGLFSVLAGGKPLLARTIVLATGLVDELPAIDGIREAWGTDLRVCPCFDGHEVRNGRFVVFGVDARLAHMASWVRMWSPDVTVVTRHAFTDVEAERMALLGIRTLADEVTGLIHEGDRLVAVMTASGDPIATDAAWVSLESRAASDLARSLCEVDELGFAKTDAGGATSRPGVFAIGNANEPLAHLVHAAASGTTVGPIVTMYLLERMLSERRTVKAA